MNASARRDDGPDRLEGGEGDDTLIGGKGVRLGGRIRMDL